MNYFKSYLNFGYYVVYLLLYSDFTIQVSEYLKSFVLKKYINYT